MDLQVLCGVTATSSGNAAAAFFKVSIVQSSAGSLIEPPPALAFNISMVRECASERRNHTIARKYLSI